MLENSFDSEIQDQIVWALAHGAAASAVISQFSQRGLSAQCVENYVAHILGSPIFGALSDMATRYRKLADLNRLMLHLESMSEARANVPAVHNITSDEFFENFYCANRPVILRGLLDSWPASKKWNMEYFRREFGQIQVSYQYRDTRNSHIAAFYKNSQNATLGSFIDMIESDSPDAKFLYLMSHDQLLQRLPFRKLYDDIDLNHGGIFDARNRFENMHLWLGPKGAITPMHRDQNNIYLAQIIGEKAIKLIPPCAIDEIYNTFGHHSDVDFTQIDFNRFPNIEKLPIIEAIVSPGEILFIPVAWWHHVTSLSLTLSITGINFRYGNDFPQIESSFF